MNFKLLKRVDIYYKLAKKFAAAPEFVKLRDEKNSKLWFADQIAKANGDKYFAVLDQSNMAAIKKLSDNGIIYVEPDEMASWYLNNDRTQRAIHTIINSYNKYFPQLDGFGIYDHLKNDGTLDPESGITSPNPIFILVHDLIHQVLQSDFTQSLDNQRERDDQGLTPSLLDELYEDVASSLSNFQPPVRTVGQGIFNYLKNIFTTKWTYNSIPTEGNLRKVIEEVFHQAKAELRGKVDSLVNKEDISNQKIPAQLKQLVDGILSSAKYQMLQQISEIVDDKPHSGTWIWEAFDLTDISEKYYQKIMESKVVNQTDSSALRGWMLECLGTMKRLNNYFKNELEAEMYEEYPEDE